MQYSLEYAEDAAAGLSRLDQTIARQVCGKIGWLKTLNRFVMSR